MDFGPLVQANNPVVREIQPSPGMEMGRPSGPHLYPEIPSHESAIGESLRILLKRKWVIISCLATIFSVVAIASLKMTPVYEAGGTIEINKPDASLNFQNSATFSLDYYDPTELETELKILQSDLLATQVIRELNLDRRPEFGGSTTPPSPASVDLAPDPLLSDPTRASALVGGFKGSLKVALSPNTRIIEVHYRSPDPQMAATVVNTLMQTYVENNFKARFESTMQASDWLQKQLVDLQMKVETSQEKLVRYQKEHEILGTDEKQNIIMEKLDELNKQLTDAESDRMNKESIYRLVQSGDPDAIASSAGGLDDGGSGNQTASQLLETLQAKEADLKIQMADLSTQFGPSYPKLAQLNNQLKEIDTQTQAEMKKIASKVRGQYTTSLQREGMLRDALEKQKQEANKLNESAITYSLLKRDVDTNRQLYEGLLQKMKEAGVSAGLKSNNFRIVDSARPPLGPIEPNIPRNLMFAIVLGSALGVGLAFLLEGLDNTVRTTEQAQMVSGLASLGMIPLGSKSAREGPNPKRLVIATSKEAVELVTQVRPQSQMAESYRALRTSLLLSNLGAPPKVIMVTSALPQEGKTTTSINAAVVLAQKGVRVLLIDADLRRPSIHKTLGMGPHSGLSNVLTGSTTLEEAITQTAILPNLFVLPAGTPPPNPAELLASSNMRDVLNELSGQYDHIVIDTPPSLSVTDAVVLSPRADAVLLVIRSGQTTKQALRRSRDILMQVNAKVVGVLLNAVDLSSPDYYYYYEYQGKYARYYREDDSSEHDEGETEESRASSTSA
ncbi:MAG TPA: polysaccharide biosynthesis tyrosine autokinase [Candidatus Sulfotelmatobacter sp.]|jgi:capsular exopolysaccharide synthesis family protein|nr:polysaccharide biosynthesis tyrosine autokinase [Candidatus Sulfotelmatobacter sp.]